MRLVFFDLETGGLDHCKHPIIQVAAVAVDQYLDELAAYEAKIDFDLATADPEALLANCYDYATWVRDSKTGLDVCYELSRFFKRFADLRMVSQRTGREYFVAQLVGHNAATFDGPFLQEFYRRQDQFMPAGFRVMDTMQRVIWHFHERPQLKPPPDFKLGTLCQYFGIPLTEAHDALADCRATVALYRALVNSSNQVAA